MIRWTCFQMDIFRPIRLTHHSNQSDGYIQWMPDKHFYHLDRKTEVIICNTACKSRRIPKYAPTFLHTTLRQNWGGRVCSNIQLVSSISSNPPLPPLSPTLLAKLHVRLTIMMAALLSVHYRKWVVFVFILSWAASKQLGSSVHGDRRWPHISSYYKQQNLCGHPWMEAVTSHVRVYRNKWQWS